MARTYPSNSIKLLYGLSACRCNFPDCRKVLAENAKADDPAIPLGRISHIYAYSDAGPRGNPNLSEKERNSYSNFILLCADHHDVIDKQPNTYSATLLIEWKRAHEQWVEDALDERTSEVTFAELEFLLDGISSMSSGYEKTDFSISPPLEKIRKNALSSRIANRIKLGMSKISEVEDFFEDIAKFNPSLPDKITNRFKHHYRQLRAEGFEGDGLFEAMHEFASLNRADFDKRAAGLAVLVYFFESCEVFEK